MYGIICLRPCPTEIFVPQSLVIRFELEPHCKDGDLPVIHPSEEILLLEQGQLDVLVKSGDYPPERRRHHCCAVQPAPHRFQPRGYHSGGGWLCSPLPFGFPTTGAVLTAVANPESSHRLGAAARFPEGFHRQRARTSNARPYKSFLTAQKKLQAGDLLACNFLSPAEGLFRRSLPFTARPARSARG